MNNKNTSPVTSPVTNSVTNSIISSCSISIKDYLLAQEIIKNNMKNIQKECPEKVLKFLLTTESQNTINRLVDCSWSDSIDKKHMIKLLKTKCDQL